VGKRWRGWYVGDDGKTRTKRFPTEADAQGWANKQRGRVVTNQWVSPDMGGDTFNAVAEKWFITKHGACAVWKTITPAARTCHVMVARLG
jgi:hypothetical protein